MRPLQWWLKSKGFSPRGKPVPHDQGHAAMPTCLGHVEETLLLVSGPGPGSSLPPRNASDGCIPDSVTRKAFPMRKASYAASRSLFREQGLRE